uniref:F-box/kelch-repeat protein n=1 Tax=Rhabditophanes sp. KR3021 TaxID=114890 RepID=A0AC35TPR3_9BILA
MTISMHTSRFTTNGFEHDTHFSSCKVNEEILMFGENEVLSFDLNEMKWSSHSKIPVPVKYPTSVLHNNSVYVVDGPISTTLRYDPREGLWERCGSTLFDGLNAAVCTYNETIMKAGGSFIFDNENGVFDEVEHGRCQLFETRNNSWREVGELPLPLSRSYCCQIQNMVQLFGGDNDEDIVQTIYNFDGTNETWSLSNIEIPPNSFVYGLNFI